MRTDRTLLAALAFGLASLATSRADAFCRTTTTKAPADYDAVSNGTCFTAGSPPLFHASSCLPYRLLTRDSPIISNTILSDRLARAFSTWTAPNATCTPGITGIELAPSSSTQIVGYTVGQPNQNLVGVSTDWPYVGVENLALATLTYDQTTGEILGADLELNAQVSWSWEETPPPEKVDLQSVLTHEVGHMLGIAHSDVEDSVMIASYQPGSTTLRKLSSDDVTAVCTVYSQRGKACELTPGTEATCTNPEISHGCGAGGTGGSAIGGGLILSLAAVLVRRRRAH